MAFDETELNKWLIQARHGDFSFLSDEMVNAARRVLERRETDKPECVNQWAERIAEGIVFPDGRQKTKP